MKELDLLLLRYLRGLWPMAAVGEKTTFEQFLALPDPVIASYLLHGETPEDPRFVALVAVLRAGRRD
jgi:succinate dehydrogenase flavin-adding protein (antitoxin of CptAB toxin-antitoxin module)